MNPLLIALIVLPVISLAALVVLNFYMTKKNSAKVTRLISSGFWDGIYLRSCDWYMRFPFTRRGCLRLQRDISSLSVYSYTESRSMTGKIYTFGLILNIALTVLSLILFQNLVYLILALLCSVVVRESLVNKRVAKLRTQLLEDELVMLSSLRQEYIRTKSVVEAFATCTCGKYVARSVSEIHDSLTAINSAEKLDAFSASTPLPTLQTLALISHVINNKGDSQTVTGVSTFASAIDMIADEVRMALRYEREQKQVFASLQFQPLVPIIGVVPIKMAFVSLIPGTAGIYEGLFGFFSTVAILSISLVGYQVVVNATRTDTVRSDDRTSLDKWLMSKKKIKELADKLVPRKQSTLMTKVLLLRRAMTRNTLSYLYLRKTYICVGTFVISLLLAISGIYIGRSSTMADVVGDAVLGASAMTDSERQILQVMDKDFFKTYKEAPTEEELTDFVKQYMAEAKIYNIEEQVTRLQKKHGVYHNIIFHWWIVLLCGALASVAYFLPESLLKHRIKIIESESVEDCLQLQTTIAIMMNTSTDTLDLLEYLYKNSRVFKSTLIDCYQNYASDPHMALNVARAKTHLPEFRNMMDKLSLTVSQISIAEAFSDLVSERDHMLRMRESAQLHALQLKRAMVRPFTSAPLIALVLLQFMAPICLLAYSMFSDLVVQGVFDI